MNGRCISTAESTVALMDTTTLPEETADAPRTMPHTNLDQMPYTVFALLIEIASAFGPVTIVRFAESSSLGPTPSDISAIQRVMTPRVVSRQALSLIDQPERDRVAAWMAQRAHPSPDGGAMAIDALYQDYRTWRAFDRLREMPELSNKIRKFGNRCYGIALTGSLSA